MRSLSDNAFYLDRADELKKNDPGLQAPTDFNALWCLGLHFIKSLLMVLREIKCGDWQNVTKKSNQ